MMTHPASVQVVSSSVEATIGLGRAWAGHLQAGDILALVGDLGAGKTHLVKGLCHGLGLADAHRRVTSPTFILVNEYIGGRLPVWHLDAYRLRGVGELDELGWDEMLDAGGVVIVEWADRVAAALPTITSQVVIRPVGGMPPSHNGHDNQRELTICGPLADRLRAAEATNGSVAQVGL